MTILDNIGGMGVNRGPTVRFCPGAQQQVDLTIDTDILTFSCDKPPYPTHILHTSYTSHNGNL